MHCFELRTASVDYYVGEDPLYGQKDATGVTLPPADSGVGAHLAKSWETSIRQALMPVTSHPSKYLRSVKLQFLMAVVQKLLDVCLLHGLRAERTCQWICSELYGFTNLNTALFIITLEQCLLFPSLPLFCSELLSKFSLSLSPYIRTIFHVPYSHGYRTNAPLTAIGSLSIPVLVPQHLYLYIVSPYLA